MNQIEQEEFADRPYEKCERSGPGALTDAELLAVILRTGTRGESSTELASRILDEAPSGGLLGLLHFSMPELMEIRGVGRVKAIELLCIGELSKRIWRTLAVTEVKEFSSAKLVAGFYMEDLRHLEQEELHLMMLNNKNVLIRELCVYRGTVNMSVASAREIFIEALRYHAVGIILVHNHPGGDPTPSEADRSFTDRVGKAGRLLGIHLLDHVVIGDQVYFSFKEWGLLTQ